MKLIVLAGLVSVEKIHLTVELAAHFTDAGQTVTVIDNVRRMAIDAVLLGDERMLRFDDDIIAALAEILAGIDSDVTLLAASETADLDALFTVLDTLRESRPDIDLLTVGLLDLRTCDCFPHLREALEQYADVTLRAPFSLEDVLVEMERR